MVPLAWEETSSSFAIVAGRFPYFHGLIRSGDGPRNRVPRSFRGGGRPGSSAGRAAQREPPRRAHPGPHLAEGNISEALRDFAQYGELLKLELGVEPTERLHALVAGLGAVTPR